MHLFEDTSQHRDQAPKGAPSSCAPTFFEARDADEHASNLTDWQQQYDQVSAGGYYGSILEIQLDEAQVFTEHNSHALHQTCNVWADSIWLGIPVNPNSESKINGLSIDDEHLMCRPGDCSFELVTPEDFDIFGIVIKQQTLMNAAETQGIELNWQDLIQHGRLALPKTTLDSTRYVLARMLKQNANLPPSRVQQDLVIMAMLELLQKESHNESIPASFQRRKNIVDTVKAFLQQHHDEPVTITQLCDIANVSRRTLQYSFETVLGISPLQYLRVSRLNGVRRRLLQSHQQESVADIAAQWGFWHLSQFAKDYKQLFGELPSHTLKKSSLNMLS